MTNALLYGIAATFALMAVLFGIADERVGAVIAAVACGMGVFAARLPS